MGTTDAWADAQRIEGWAGEVRVNLLRIVALVAFYTQHLLNVYLWEPDRGAIEPFHAAVTLVVLAWASAAVVLHVFLKRRWVPPTLKYVATACDTLLITAVLLLDAEPRTTLAVLYFLVVIAAGLRLSLPLIYCATLGSMLAYLFFLGYVKYGLEIEEAKRVPRPQQVVFLLALATAGLLSGQVVRQARRLLGGYAVSVVPPKET